MRWKMFFQQILVTIFQQLQGERSLMAPFYILRGKKSGQTLQDIHYYSVQSFFGITPELSKETYQTELDLCISNEWITNIAQPSVTTKGLELLHSFHHHFAGYEVNHNLDEFDKKLQLLVQVSSNMTYQNTSYYPIVQDEFIQNQCKNWLLRNRSLAESTAIVKDSIFHFLTDGQLREEEKTIFIFRQSGFQVAGLTWGQLAERLHKRQLDIAVHYRSILSFFILFLKSKQSPLLELILFQNLITETASRTLELVMQGHDLPSISRIRRLKESTIEDHFVEIAGQGMIDVTHNYLSDQDVLLILKTQQEASTHQLRKLKELLPQFTYFQLRLALAKGGAANEST